MRIVEAICFVTAVFVLVLRSMKWFSMPPERVRWPWRRLQFVWLERRDRYWGFGDFYYDWPVPAFGFGLFHILLDYKR